MKISFSPPYIDQEIIDEVVDSLKSGWITTGPKTKQFETELAAYMGVKRVLNFNSATAGMELMLRWFGIKEGDEVIVPAYTYCATANIVVHCGATPVMVDVDDNFLLDIEAVKKAITPKTKAIIPVDLAGMPCDYDAFMQLVNSDEVRKNFHPNTPEQQKLGRPFLMIDAAHSVGAVYKGKKVGGQADAMVFSFHAVKNLTTAEGGCVAFGMDGIFNSDELYTKLNTKSLHGQNKDALSKTQTGAWRYDVIEAGFKCNMPDVLAAIGLASFKKYDSYILPERYRVFAQYQEAFSKYEWAQLPVYKTEDRLSSCHVYPLRIKDFNEQQRDELITQMAEAGISTNVHFQPLPMLSVYKNMGYKISDYPVSLDNYTREISLPVYPHLTKEEVEFISQTLVGIVEAVFA